MFSSKPKFNTFVCMHVCVHVCVQASMDTSMDMMECYAMHLGIYNGSL